MQKYKPNFIVHDYLVNIAVYLFPWIFPVSPYNWKIKNAGNSVNVPHNIQQNCAPAKLLSLLTLSGQGSRILIWAYLDWISATFEYLGVFIEFKRRTFDFKSSNFSDYFGHNSKVTEKSGLNMTKIWSEKKCFKWKENPFSIY